MRIIKIKKIDFYYLAFMNLYLSSSKFWCTIIFYFIQLIFPLGANCSVNLDEEIILCDYVRKNSSNQISDGYRAFIVSSEVQLSNILDSSYHFLKRNEEEIIILILENPIPTAKSLIEKHKAYELLETPSSTFIRSIDLLVKQNKRLIIFSNESSLTFFNKRDHICYYEVNDTFPVDYMSGFRGDQSKDLVVFNMDSYALSHSESPVDSIPIQFNSISGKLPNFFMTEFPQYYHSFIEYMGAYKWHTATVRMNDSLLSDMSWKEMPRMRSYGKVHTHERQISPQKDGFQFSPDVFQFNKINSFETKIFHATPRELTDGLILFLDFSKDNNNLLNEGMIPTYSKLKYVKDEQRKWCASFNGESDYIDYASGLDIIDNLTLSVWVKPENIEGNQSILGKGETFSVKYRDGRLLFTSPGIKDHITDSIVVKSHQWQHISYVFSANKKLRFYINGIFVGEKKAAGVTPTNNSVLIGTNLWGEYFHGKMDDLAIWNRSLSDEEIIKIYQKGISLDSPKRSKWYLLGVSCLIILVLLIYLYRRSKRGIGLPYFKKNSLINKPSNKEHRRDTTPIIAPSIQLIGRFRMINRDGTDISSKFSTRRKQLFILILLSKYRGGGIVSSQLTDNLWPGYSSDKAKNNRSTQMKRLREILNLDTGVSIEFFNKKWCINLEHDVYLDLDRYFQLQNKIIEDQYIHLPDIEDLLDILEKGPLLPNLNEIWLDDFKSQFEDKLFDLLMPLYENQDFILDNHRVIRLSNVLLIYDPLNEVAIEHKVRSLISLNKISLARDSITHFYKIYQQYYNQPYDGSLSELFEM
ncbi:hypothetical protein K5X82_06090 [Halosquirtibacter xylanolyticus]|uniref:LamG-like jellyroll fold domain-containing protein n=1 Tax=Halosquirtibacter xylanolyticus TaxID=3374599 RepID=UPI0037480040|nr:hypothetical protein K5X82_06090 [Prolixibacteraceae bacterium]